uniref:Uncharacterized protein n=1 Tax=Rhizophora mucronata TaxID=61149 RepID=A0A2P2PI33_RHIMU
MSVLLLTLTYPMFGIRKQIHIQYQSSLTAILFNSRNLQSLNTDLPCPRPIKQIFYPKLNHPWH